MFEQVIGIHIEPICVPLLAEMLMRSNEADLIQSLLKSENVTKSFNFTFRYIDYVFSPNNNKFGDFIHALYPEELEIKDTTVNPEWRVLSVLSMRD